MLMMSKTLNLKPLLPVLSGSHENKHSITLINKRWLSVGRGPHSCLAKTQFIRNIIHYRTVYSPLSTVKRSK